MQNMINQFTKIAPFIVASVKERITASMDEAQVCEVIHEEILAYFTKQQSMTLQYVQFDDQQRATFATVMYELLKPMAEKFKDAVNPLYAEYVRASGKAGALNYITNA